MKPLLMLQVAQKPIYEKLEQLCMQCKDAYVANYTINDRVIISEPIDTDGFVVTIGVGNSTVPNDLLTMEKVLVNITLVTPESHHLHYTVFDVLKNTKITEGPELGLGIRIDLIRGIINALDAAITATAGTLPNPMVFTR